MLTLMPISVDQFGPAAYLWTLLLAAPLLLLEQRRNLRRTLAVLAVGAALSLATSFFFGLSDFGRFALLVEFAGLAFLLPRSSQEPD